MGCLPAQMHGLRHRPRGEIEKKQRSVAYRVLRLAGQRDPERIRGGDH